METVPQGNPQKQEYGPSDHLIAMLRTCSTDPTEALKARLRRMLHTFLLHHRDNVDNEQTKELAAKCCYEAGFWYYRILENLVRQERKRLGVSGISGVLATDLVQCCLVACCLEVTICTNNLPCDFPLLLHILKIESYHFWRVIELVLRADAGLPRHVARHLSQVEERVLESLAWTSNSPLWEEIRANDGHLPTCQQVTPPTQLEGPEVTDTKPDPEPPADAHRPQRRRSPFHLFARKVYSLVSRRLRVLGTKLNISDELRLKIWTCFEYSLVDCTHLMADRHLDQLLMCAIYIIAKITKAEIPFRSIMKCYKSQPHANRSVCTSVLISGGNVDNAQNNNGEHSSSIPTPNTPSAHYPGALQEQRGNLIYFYNQLYTAKMQHFAEQFALTSAGDTPPLSPYPRQWTASFHRHQLSGSPSIFISPFTPETPSPHTARMCYYFNTSPPECLREINNMIKTGRSASRRRRAVSLEEEEEEGADCPPAKRLELDDQSAWQRRLRNVVNERVAGGDQEQTSPLTEPDLH